MSKERSNLRPSRREHTGRAAFAVTFILSRLRIAAACLAVTRPCPCPFPCPSDLEPYRRPSVIVASLTSAQGRSDQQVGPGFSPAAPAASLEPGLLAVVRVAIQSYLN